MLVIEDDPNVSRLLEIYLEEAGYQVEVSASGEDGLARAQAGRFEAILLDVLLPGLDGWHVLTSLKSEPKTREVPVLIVSVVDDRQMGLALGAVDYLVKPIHRAALIGAMSRLEQGRAVPHADSLVLGIDDDPVALRLYQATLEGMGSWLRPRPAARRDCGWPGSSNRGASCWTC
ncbi:Response regulator receiver protein [mine drainage metagenome]|uniref:Response regulator receiver protein n=1 Tax=mine drainage metagenome TaxID=410659 RepID=T0YJ62_9ZZZZ